jgi:integrator complex subunit 9
MLSTNFEIISGSCNWQLDINVNHNQTSKIETSSSSSSQSNLTRFIYMSSSTTLETYSSKFIYDSFINCDYLLLTNLSRISSIDASLNATELTTKIENILNDHGSVLIPCSSTGLIYDMFEFLTKYFEQINLLNIHMYFISPISNANLSISNAMSEWVTEQRQIASFSGTPPFKHNELIKSKCLITISSDCLDDTESLINFEQPSIIFTGHISLRYGPIVQLIEKMKISSSNGIIFVDNHYSYIDALKPYQPINMKCFYLPIDTRLNISQINILLNDKIRPKTLILHEQYSNDIIRNDRMNILSYKKYDNIKLPSINRSFINGQLNIKNDIKPKVISSSNNLAIASIHGHLDMCDYVYDINEIDNENHKQNNLITYGRIDIDKFLINLSKNGLFGLEIKQLHEYDYDYDDNNEQFNKSIEIKYNQGAAKIIVRPKQTDIECNDPLLMTKIRDALLMDNIGTL